MDLGLTDKVALITGGTSGIGLAIAQRLAEEGCRDRDLRPRRGKLDKAVATLKSAEAKGFVADVCKPADVAALVDDTVKAFGRIDIVVSNAGTHIAGQYRRCRDRCAAAAFPDQGDRPVGAGARASRRTCAGRAAAVSSSSSARPERCRRQTPSPPRSSTRRSTPSSNRCRTNSRADKILVNAVCPSRIKSPLTDGAQALQRGLSRPQPRAAGVAMGRRGAARPLGHARTTSRMRSHSWRRSAPASSAAPISTSMADTSGRYSDWRMIRIENVSKSFYKRDDRRRCGREHQPDDRAARDRRGDRAERLRQVDLAQHDRGALRADARPASSTRARPSPTSTPTSDT